MAWIKRNLFFILSLVTGLSLTGYCGYLFFFSDLSQNAAVYTEFQGDQTRYNELQRKPAYPSDEHIKQVKAELAAVKDFEDQIHKSFSPYPTPPSEDEKGFSEYLEDTIAKLKASATNASVGLPDDIAFGFTDLRGKLRYELADIPLWMQQLSEVKALCDVLFQARINSLALFRRVGVSSNDLFVTPNDTFPASMVIASTQTRTPYKVEFRCFSRELASVMESLARSSNFFIVKNIVVMPAGMKIPEIAPPEPAAAPATVAETKRAAPSAAPSVDFSAMNRLERAIMERQAMEARAAQRAAMEAGQAAPSRAAAGPVSKVPVTVLREQLLYITLSVEAVKLN